MKIKMEVKMSMVLYHKLTMEKLVLDNTINKVYDEESSEYTELCNKYINEIGFEREQDIKEFDETLMKLCVRDAKKAQIETVEQITETVKKCYREKATAYIAFAGAIINPNDFCAVCIEDLTYNVVKE